MNVLSKKDGESVGRNSLLNCRGGVHAIFELFGILKEGSGEVSSLINLREPYIALFFA